MRSELHAVDEVAACGRRKILLETVHGECYLPTIITGEQPTSTTVLIVLI